MPGRRAGIPCIPAIGAYWSDGEPRLRSGSPHRYPAVAIPTIGAFRCEPPMEPRNGAL